MVEPRNWRLAPQLPNEPFGRPLWELWLTPRGPVCDLVTNHATRRSKNAAVLLPNLLRPRSSEEGDESI